MAYKVGQIVKAKRKGLSPRKITKILGDKVRFISDNGEKGIVLARSMDSWAVRK